MARVLSAFEKSVLLSQVHPELNGEMQMLDGNPESYRYSDLVYPQAGRAVRWPDGSYTLVWRDAMFRWWFINVTEEWGDQANKPLYLAPGASFLNNVIETTEEMIKAGVNRLPSIGAGIGAGAVFALAVLVMLQRR